MSKRCELVVGIGLGLTMVGLCLSIVTPVLAQLNEHCTISILNRTAQVQPNGGWRIANVPANFGRLRARATCIENSVTRSGQSDYFTLTQNRVTGFNAEMPLGVVDPIPATLTLAAPASTLPTVGATTQLTVTAKLPDGGTEVKLASGDSDGDGIPADVERANGLDPNNPLDGFADPDHDGLTTKQELMDFGTNPWVADTDGDGIQDGLEITTGSDPTDPTSFNLAQALASLV